MPLDFRIQPDWDAHSREVKIARGSACFAALAAHFGTNSPKVLESRADARPLRRGDDEQSSSNKYLRWRQGKIPHDKSVAQIRVRTGGSVNLAFWRDHPLWELLAPEPPSIPRLLRLLEGTPSNIRRILFHKSIDTPTERVNHTPLTRAEVLGIRNLRSLDAFTTLLCLARKGDVLEDGAHHFLPSACAFDLLPRILYSYRPLRYRWEGLFGCIERVYWNRLYLDGIYSKFPIERVRDSLTQLDADPSVCLPSISGMRKRASTTYLE